MTVRARSADEVLRTLSAVAAGLDLWPKQDWSTTGPPDAAITSVRLSDPTFSTPWWGHTSGHSVGGATDALAGAYGELVENVSCDVWYPDWLPCRREIAPLWDEDLVDGETCARSLPPGTGVRAVVEACPADRPHRVHPYANLADPAERIAFPREIGLEVAGRNNGGAVGSDPAEALVTGLYEVFERFVLGKFSLRTERFPLIDPAVFADGRIARLAAHRKAEGTETLYVDLSLGGRLPVVGVLLLHPERDAMSLAVAGHHDVHRAIEHCFREMAADAYYRDRLDGWRPAPEPRDLVRHWARSGFTVGWGGGLGQIDFARGWSTDWARAFRPGATDNRELLREAIAACRGFGAEAYARDCSILGIPAFHVYAGALSENLFVAHEGLLDPAENARLLAAVTRDRWLHEHLPILDRAVAGDFSGWTALAALLDDPFVGYPADEDVCDCFHWPVPDGVAPRGVSLGALVAGLAFHAGDRAAAARLWREARGDAPVGHFLDRAAATDPDAARREFAAAFGASRAEAVERTLAVDALIRIPLRPGDTGIERTWQRFRERAYPRREGAG